MLGSYTLPEALEGELLLDGWPNSPFSFSFSCLISLLATIILSLHHRGQWRILTKTAFLDSVRPNSATYHNRQARRNYANSGRGSRGATETVAPTFLFLSKLSKHSWIHADSRQDLSLRWVFFIIAQCLISIFNFIVPRVFQQVFKLNVTQCYSMGILGIWASGSLSKTAMPHKKENSLHTPRSPNIPIFQEYTRRRPGNSLSPSFLFFSLYQPCTPLYI